VVRLAHQRQWRCLYRSPGAAAGDTNAHANGKSIRDADSDSDGNRNANTHIHSYAGLPCC